MEKEQKKLLLVAVSVGVFLLVTITVAIILLTQKAVPQESGNSAAITYTAPQSVQVQPVEPAVIDIPDETAITEESNKPEEVIAFDLNDGENITIHIPSPTTAAVPITPEIVPAPVAVPKVTAPAKTTPKPAATAKTVSTTKSTAAKPSAGKTINDYWIQTGAFSARVRAEDAKEKLAEKGLTSIIENREINGQLWYRVRLGPYTSQKEADYWLALVKSIDGFGESQVRQTTRVQ